MAKKDSKKEALKEIIEEVPEAEVVEEKKEVVVDDINAIRKKYFAAYGEWPLSDEDLRIAGLL
mgnify:CR=1 FL=1